jgi:hypothetical protein
VQKTSFRCKLEFEIAGVRYFIQRNGTLNHRTGSVKVDVKFWKTVNGVDEELHGTARRDTNEVIRDYVGSYDDFILTAASFQSAKNNVSFIDMGNSERKDLLVQFIGLNVFDRLQEAANERNKELNTMLKLHKDKNYPFEKQQNENALSHADTLLAQLTDGVESLKKQVADVNEQIVLETVNLIKLDVEVPTNITQLMERKKSQEEAVSSKKAALEGFRKLTNAKDVALADFNAKIAQIESSNLVESHKTHRQLSDKITEVKQKIDLKKVEIKGKLEKVARLDKHEYDPNCKYCTNNSFVKDATKAKKELNEDKKDTDKMLETLDNLNVEFAKFKWVEQAYETYTKLLTDRSKIKDEVAVLSRNIIVATNELEKLEATLKNTLHQID